MSGQESESRYCPARIGTVGNYEFNSLAEQSTLRATNWFNRNVVIINHVAKPRQMDMTGFIIIITTSTDIELISVG